MALPTLTTEIAFSSTWNSGAPVWTDVSAYVRAVDTSRGRASDTDSFSVGTARITLDNRDGRFNPSNTGSPYSPNVLPRKQIRIRATYNTATRTNLVTNPSFETNTTGWGSYQASNVRTAGTISGGVGSWSVVSTATATGVGGPFFNFTPTPGQTLTASIQCLRTSGTRSYRLGYEFYNGATFISSPVGTAQTCATSTRLSVTATVPATATNAYITLYSTGTGSIGDAIQIDAALLEQASTVGDYFDGSTSPLCSWTGTVNNSTSVEQTTTFPLFRGWVQTWPQEYPATGKDAVTTISAVDSLAILGGMTAPVDEMAARIASGELPTPYLRYKMGDTNTARPRYVDASGNGRDMPSGSFQATGPQLAPYLSDASSAFAYGNGASGIAIAPTASTNWTVTFWMQSTQVGASATSYATIFAMGVYEQIPTRIAIDESGYIYAKAYDFIPGVSPSARSTVKVNDGIPHHVAVTSSGGSGLTIYVDGVDRTSTIVSASAGQGGAITLARPPITSNAAGATDIDYYGFLQEVCYWQSTLTATQVGYVYGIGTGLATGELTSARANRLISAVWPAASTSVATGVGYCSTAEYNLNALTALQNVAATEGALFFADRSGTLVFRNRYYAQQVTEGLNSQATFGDDSGIGYESIGFQYDADQMANTYVITSGIGVPQTASNASSVTAYGTRSQTITTLLSTVDALSMAQGLAAQYGTPVLRSTPFTVNLQRDSATSIPGVLNLELGYRITLRRNANGVASTIVQQLTLNSISHSIRPGSWITTLDGSPRATYTWFTVNASLLDGTHVLGY